MRGDRAGFLGRLGSMIVAIHRALWSSWFGVVLLLAPSLRAEDAGPGDGEIPTYCGDLDRRGACLGDVAVWCEAENAAGESPLARTASVDCGGLTSSTGPLAARCLMLPELGAVCASGDSSACLIAPDGVPRQLYCDAPGPQSPPRGCDLSAGCVAVSGSCVPDPAPPSGTRTPYCIESFLVLACPSFGQPAGVDCARGGGACITDHCEGGAPGSPCDAQRLFCADGLRCVGAADGFPGTCAELGPTRPMATVAMKAPPPLPPPESCAQAMPAEIPFLCVGAGVWVRRRRARRGPQDPP